ncbi:MAG: Cu(I)/Ag(I) efflux system membrane fusion protein [Arcobacteraceae bacterium]|jgi:Cu(I)/Ag(I) efflux system membrane fusion protein
MRILIYIAVLVAVINAQPLDVTQVFNKKTVKVEKKIVNLSKTFYGDVHIPDDSIKDINIRFDGFVDKVYANKTFMYIKKGEKLFDIYSDEINLVMSEFLLRDVNLRRNYVEKFKSYDIDTKVINDLTKNKKVKDYIDIYSPYDGFLISKKINDGSFAKKGKNLFQIANFEKLWVIVKVYQNDLKSIQKDMRAKINIDGVGVLNSKVDFIYPNVDVKDKTIRVRFEIDNKDLKVFPNMFAKVSINTVQKSMLVLPKTAVLTKADKHYVFIPDGNSFEPKEITATRINSDEFEVIGLNENEIVIDKAMFLLDSDAITNGLYGSSIEDEEW